MSGCSGTCTNEQTDSSNCGGCGIVCGAGTSCASGICQCLAVTSDLFAYYTFDATLADFSGNGHTATGSNLASVGGKIGTAYGFDGSNSMVELSGVAGTFSGARSFCAWVNPAATTQTLPVLEVGYTFTTFADGNMFSLNGSQAGTGLCGETASVPFLDHWAAGCYLGGSAAPANAWSFVCWTWDGQSALTTYVNGTPKVSAGAMYGYPIDTMYIGANTIGGSTTSAWFSGDIDEVGIWTCALSAANVSTLYNNGAGFRP